MTTISYKRLVNVYSPCSSAKTNIVNVCEISVPLTDKETSIYETIESFEKNIFHSIQFKTKKIKKKVQLRSIINLHNSKGIKDINQIRKMILQIKVGKNIFQPSGIPNIKIVKSIKGELILFDGHHSMLAYMASGKPFLHEIPHLLVSKPQGGVRDKDILIFFGSHASKIYSKHWRHYVINWQATENKQLSKRIQQDMGELYDSLSDVINSPY